jgi:hypothetical protein
MKHGGIQRNLVTTRRDPGQALELAQPTAGDEGTSWRGDRVPARALGPVPERPPGSCPQAGWR